MPVCSKLSPIGVKVGFNCTSQQYYQILDSWYFDSIPISPPIIKIIISFQELILAAYVTCYLEFRTEN